MEGSVPKRTYGLFARSAPLESPTTERPLTPAEELSSWLPDENCAACGAPVKTRQLYCSAKCRDQEEQERSQAAAAVEPSTELTTTSTASTSAALAQSATLSSSAQPLLASSRTPNLGGLRVPAYARTSRSTPALHEDQAQDAVTTTTSPQRATGRHVSQPLPSTSTASVLSRSFNRRKCRPTSGGSSGDDTLESGANSAGPRVGRGSDMKRNSSQSSMSSSPSSSAIFTDLSTPSPALKANMDDSVAEDEAELNSSDFNLPPPVIPGSNGLKRRASMQQHAWQASQSSQSSHLPSEQLPTYGFMSYARRPSSTNLPAPVIYSPVMTAASGRSAGRSSSVRTDKSRGPMTTKQTKEPSQGTSAFQSTAGRHHTASDIASKREGPSALAADSEVTTTAEFDLPQSALAAPATNNVFVFKPGPSMNRSSSDPARQPIRSSPQADYTSSSSGCQTLTASFPSPRLVSFDRATNNKLSSTGTIERCGRPGCAGASVDAESIPARHREASSLSQREISRSLRAPLGMMDARVNSSRASYRHKHTHSAGAEMTIHHRLNEAASKHGGSQTRATGIEAASSSNSGTAAEPSPTNVAQAGVQIHPRGRSKARGCRSVSRRSRSPPRAAARGRSVALMLEEKERKHANPDSPPLDAVKPQSQPIAIAPRGDASSPSDHSSSPSDDSAADIDEACSPRGRSPAERRRRFSRPRNAGHGSMRKQGALTQMSPQNHRVVVDDETDDEISKVVGGNGKEGAHFQSKRHLDRYVKTAADSDIDPGFDDVEGLELDS
ncbi:unnamed protein product [Jaminaea pallidilutea]